MKYSQGTWNQSLNTLSKNGQRIIQTDEEVFIAYVQTEDTGEREAEANAKLISAAPLLLEALQMIMNATHDESYMDDAIKYAEKAIKKATE